MKPTAIFNISGTFILISCSILSCSVNNKILTREDPYKEQQTVKLSQSLKGYSDELNMGLLGRPHYYVRVKYFHAETNNNEQRDLIEIRLRTSVRPEEMEGILYIHTDDEIIPLNSEAYISKLYQESSTTTSSETTTTTSSENESSGSEDEEKENTEVTTTQYETTTSQDTHQMMNHVFAVDPGIWNLINTSGAINYRIYLGKESIDIPIRGKYKKALKNFTSRILQATGSPGSQ